MPQVDMETLVSVCGGGSHDRKIACETLANRNSTDDQLSEIPPESFWLSKDAELDWLDQHAFIERKDSAKGISNSNTNIHANANPSNSQRFSNLKATASIIGLPKPQKSCFVDAKHWRQSRAGTRLFPKRTGSSGKSDSSMVEPSSPKVSCIGRVKSRRDRNRRLKNRQRSSRETENPESKEKTGGFFASIKSIFRYSSRPKQHKQKREINKSHAQPTPRTMKTNGIRDRTPEREREAEASPRRSVSDVEVTAGEPLSLGGMKRFTSGRKSESWATGIDVA
ncbi:hypothetical protein K2173_018520 [Erythroxylum novogranatense]|uniref:Uncharacterized protein n=1 Tax=Erythroxylum novogranatense TaxID=1862640 RepID=A0AAV8UFF6_9ROSI|nr:hypothetical protein K2173_018520 [Erythroxylum novogranatense]